LRKFAEQFRLLYIMAEIERNVFKKLQAVVNEKRLFIQVLLGPRQVGKTTMVRQLLEKSKTPSMYVSADGIGF
jgi:predicted AAA+ superfamily ATPase